ncbi:MAG: NAD(P)-binding protein [Propionibacteriaceae bacterium]|jgi:protoporphyrinogen oxidase|nr:NAD(P)-binding protein [Propionibacteriaceae bacterium]
MRTIAIVGAGAAGVMAAYRVRQQLGPKAEITVFERQDRVGGRARRDQFAGAAVEFGVPALPADGQWVKSLFALAGLKPKPGRLVPDAAGKRAGFWNGAGWTLAAKPTAGGLTAGAVRRYGPASLVRLAAVTRQTASKWNRIYDWQKSGRLFTTPAELLGALDLADLTQVSLRHALGRSGVRGDFTSEIVSALTRRRYAQDAGLNALAGQLGLAGTGLGGGSTQMLAEGTQTLFQQTLDRLQVELLLGRRVIRVESPDPAWRPDAPTTTRRRRSADNPTLPAPSGKLTVLFKEGAKEGKDSAKDSQKRQFDAVIVAAPLELADLKVSAARRLVRTPPRQFQEVHVTLVAGTPSKAYFGLGEDEPMPGTVFAASSPKTPFLSLGVVAHSPVWDRPIWQFFTAGRSLSEATLGRVFSERLETSRFVWKGAYPVLAPGVEAAAFLLAPGVAYTNGLESAASSVDLATVAGYNAAGLVLQHLL